MAIHPEVEAVMAATHMALMAHSLGLGACFCGLLDYAADKSLELCRFMGLPPGHRAPISFILGYPRRRYQRLVARRPVQANWL